MKYNLLLERFLSPSPRGDEMIQLIAAGYYSQHVLPSPRGDEMIRPG